MINKKLKTGFWCLFYSIAVLNGFTMIAGYIMFVMMQVSILAIIKVSGVSVTYIDTGMCSIGIFVICISIVFIIQIVITSLIVIVIYSAIWGEIKFILEEEKEDREILATNTQNKTAKEKKKEETLQ